MECIVNSLKAPRLYLAYAHGVLRNLDIWSGTLITSTFFLGGRNRSLVAIHSYDTIAQHSSNDTAYQANEKNAAFDTSLSSKTKKKMLIKHDSIVKCTDVNNHREEGSGNKDIRRTTNEDTNDSWNINHSDSSDIGSGYETNDDEEEVTHGVAENIERAFNADLSTRSKLENPTRPARYIGQSKRTQRRKNAALKRAVVGTKPLTAYIIKQMAEHEQEGEENWQQDDSAESSESNNNTSNWTDAKLSASLEKLKAMEEEGKDSQAAQNRYDAVTSYLCLVKAGFKREEASKLIAEGAGRGIYFARSIGAWAAMFLNDGELPISLWGKHAKRLSYLKDEDCILRLQHYLRKKIQD
uniref:AlNc14C93G5766 protein n=1 Tax=Albugo laibachii Nc14 TaxID=890382 RepID=F0WGN8_9STRA|nr:AlNc14C93G5766 [Albugo laibachii Nc14]|eukprot:CCA20402.1 AlNc14C93G5766 [Albugo laibachii Nc14]